MEKMFQLFWTFCKIGTLTFGGGWALISIIEQEIVQQKKWLQKDEFFESLAFCQSLPGSLVINMASYVGRLTNGTIGSLVGVLGASLPALVTLLLISIFYRQFSSQTWWLKFVSGLLSVILALIIKSGLDLAKQVIHNQVDLIVLAVGLILIFSGVHPLLIIVMGGVWGIGHSFLTNKKKQQMLLNNEVEK